ncbi:hypothetical protein D3C73_216140 [compost metagenome]
MPTMIPLTMISSNNNLDIVPLDPPPTSIPAIFDGMQFFMDSTWDGAVQNGRFPANSPVAAWQNAYYMKWFDAIDRLRWKAPDGSTPLAAMSTNPNNNGGWPLLNSESDNMIGGLPVMMTSSAGQVLDLNGRPTDIAYRDAQNTPTYTYYMLFKVDPGTLGGLLGPSSGTEEQAAWRFGFSSTNANGKLIYQHTAQNRITIDRVVDNWKPTIAIITCDATNHGAVTIVNDGIRTDTPFTFTSSFKNTDHLTVGAVGTGSNGTRRCIANLSRWSRPLKDSEVNALVSWANGKYGQI